MQTICANITSRDTIQTVYCNTGMPVRFLTIRHDSQTQLGFCEVVVIGYQYKGKLMRATKILLIQTYWFTGNVLV